MFALESCIAYLTNQSGRYLTDVLDKRIRQHGITRVQWYALYYIAKSDKITQTELAEKMGTTEPSVARLLDRLEKEGMVTRVNSDHDRRIHYLELTEEGKKLNRKIVAVAEKFKDEAIIGISDKELESFEKVLEKMKANFTG